LLHERIVWARGQCATKWRSALGGRSLKRYPITQHQALACWPLGKIDERTRCFEMQFYIIITYLQLPSKIRCFTMRVRVSRLSSVRR
jgi:hypothetical protein